MQDLLSQFRQITRQLTAPGGAFALDEVEVAGQTVRVFARAPKSLNAIYDSVIERHGDKVMLAEGDARWTYAEIFDQGARLANVMRDEYGVKPGDRVAIAMRNRPEWFPVFIAVTRIGAVAAILNSRGSADEMAGAVEQVGCALVIADAERAERIASVSTVRIPALDALLKAAESASPALAEIEIDAEAPALILFTSGTTGRAKGATLTQRNLCNMYELSIYTGALNVELRAHRMGVDASILRANMSAPSSLLIVPLFHISGIVTMFVVAAGGGMMTLMRRWDPEAALNVIQANRITAVTGPTLIMSDMLAREGAAERMQTISSMVIGGQASPIGLCENIRQMLPRASQGAGWGMTECAGSAASASGLMFDAFPGSVGLPQPVFDLKVVGPDGQTLNPNEVGEFHIRGSMVMQGYWNDEQATQNAFADGWYRTGDLGYLTEDGLIYIVDRAKDMVISAGENIYCAEVERVLQATASFVEVALFGVPDERLGERAIAAVTLREEQSLDAEAVKAIVRANLADYKVPAEVLFDISPLPRNAVGKVDKVALKKLYLESRVPA